MGCRSTHKLAESHGHIDVCLVESWRSQKSGWEFMEHGAWALAGTMLAQ
jgi:hypothetical protein